VVLFQALTTDALLLQNLQIGSFFDPALYSWIKEELPQMVKGPELEKNASSLAISEVKNT
jgi:hypothetical protein